MNRKARCIPKDSKRKGEGEREQEREKEKSTKKKKPSNPWISTGDALIRIDVLGAQVHNEAGITFSSLLIEAILRKFVPKTPLFFFNF